MFDNLFKGNKEEKSQLQAEQRAMNFSREQGIVQPNAAENTTDLMQMEGRSDLIKWQQELDEDLFKLCCKLTGWKESIDEQGQRVWIKNPKKALCNELFIDDVVVPQLSPFLNKNFINSTLQEERILKMLEHTSNDIADNMCDNYDQYGIDFINYDIVLRALKDFLTPAGFRCLDGFTKIKDSTIMKRIESSSENNTPVVKKGLFGLGG